MPDVAGRFLSLTDYQGKWVVINLWATWCPPCLEEIPQLASFHQAHSHRDAVVLGVNIQDSSSDRELREFVRHEKIPYPVVRGTPEIMAFLGRVKGLPTTYLLDPSGRLAARESGPLTQEDLEAFIHDYHRSPTDGNGT